MIVYSINLVFLTATPWSSAVEEDEEETTTCAPVFAADVVLRSCQETQPKNISRWLYRHQKNLKKRKTNSPAAAEIVVFFFFFFFFCSFFLQFCLFFPLFKQTQSKIMHVSIYQIRTTEVNRRFDFILVSHYYRI